MNVNYGMRWTHRWLSVVFTAAVLFDFATVATGRYANWMGFLPLGPLFVMLATGLYLFVLPYVRRGRTRAAAA